MNEIVDLAAKAIEYKLLSDNDVPAKEFQEWKTLFVSGKPIKLKDEQPVVENPEEEVRMSCFELNRSC